MAIAKTTSTLIGVKEDVVNRLFNVAPHRHAFMNSIKKNTCATEFVEWLTDTDIAANTGAAVDFTIPSSTAYTNSVPTKVSNRVERFEEFVGVSDKSMAVSTYGGSSAFGYQTAKAIKAIKDGVETRMVGASNAAVASVANTTGAQMANYLNFVTSNVVDAGTSGTPATVVEDDLNELMSDIWKVSSVEGNYNVLVSPGNKRVISKFLDAKSNVRRDLGWSGSKLSSSFDGYMGDFGMLAIMPSQFISDSVIFMYNPTMFEHTTLNGFAPKVTPLGKEARTTRAVVDTACTLKSLNELASGHIRYVALT